MIGCVTKIDKVDSFYRLKELGLNASKTVKPKDLVSNIKTKKVLIESDDKLKKKLKLLGYTLV